jgi:hypothetical protein
MKISQAQYESNERAMLAIQIARVESAPLVDRRAGRDSLAEALTVPGLIEERLRWLLEGCYGYGAMMKAKEIAASKMNRPAALMQLLGAVEWQCPGSMTRAMYLKLSPADQQALNAVIMAVIDSQEVEAREAK